MKKLSAILILVVAVVLLTEFSVSKSTDDKTSLDILNAGADSINVVKINDLSKNLSKTYGVGQESINITKIDAKKYLRATRTTGEGAGDFYEARIKNRLPQSVERIFVDAGGNPHLLSKDFNAYLESSKKRANDEDSAVDIATQYVENGFADKFSLPRVLQSASDISGNTAKKYANEIHPPSATMTEEGYAVKLYSWSEANGVLVEWDVNVSDKIDAATWKIIDTGVGDYFPQTEGFLPVPGKSATIAAEPARLAGTVNVTVNSTYADIVNNSGTTTVEPVNITLTDFDANQNVTVTIVLFSYPVSSRTISKTINVTNATTNSAGTAYLVYYPNPDSHTGVGDIIANQSNLPSKSSTLWKSTGNYFVVEKIAFNKTFDNFANFSVYYFSANFDWNQTKADLFASYVLEGATRAYETFVGKWNLTYPDTDNSSYITISDGANDDSVRFEKGPNYICTCIFSGNDTNIGIQGDLQDYLSSSGYTYPSEQNMTFSVVGHEFFHNIQYGYESWKLSDTLIEGMARFSESANEQEANFQSGSLFYANNANGVNGYISNPDRSISSFTYSYAIYWGYVYSNDGGVPLIRRTLQEANRYVDSSSNIPVVVSISLGNISGWHKSFNESLFDFSAAVFTRNFTWGKYDGTNQKGWGAKMKNVSLTAFSYTSLSPFSGTLSGTVNAWAMDFINVSVPISNYALNFSGSGDFRLKLVYRNASNNITEQNINMTDTSNAIFTISNGTIHDTIALIISRVSSSSSGSYSLRAMTIELPETGTPLLYTNNTPMIIPDNNMIGNFSSVTVAENKTINKVRVYVGISHTYIGDLRVELVTPNNTRIMLHNRSGVSTNDIFTWYENQTAAASGALDNLQNYYSGGTWLLNATDFAAEDRGNITRWTLLLFVDMLSNPANLTLFSNNLTFPASGTTYAPRQNYSFQIFWNDSLLGPSAVTSAAFQFNSTNYSRNSNPAVQNNSLGIFWINLTDVAAGTYDLVWYANNTNNTWNSSMSSYYIARNYSAQFINLTINETNDDKYFVYSSITNITGFKFFDEGGLTLYRNESVVGTESIQKPNETLILAGGIHNYTLIYFQTQNYSFVNITRFVRINRSNALNVTLWINGALSDTTFNFSQPANFTAIVNVTGKNITLLSNMSFWLEQNATTILYNITTLKEIGIFYVKVNFHGDENYTASSDQRFITVNDVNAPTLFFNVTTPSPSAEYYPGRTYYFNISAQDEINVSKVVLQFDSTNYSASRHSGSDKEGNWFAAVADLSANSTGYPIVWYVNDTSGNSVKSGAWYYAISKNSSEYSVISVNKTQPEILEYINLTAFSPIDRKINVTLYSNQSGVFTFAFWSNFGQTTINFSAIGIYNFSANFSGNENYTANSTLEYSIITVLDTTAPALSSGIVSPTTVRRYDNFSVFVTMYDLSERANATLMVYNSTNSSVFPIQNLTKRPSPELFFTSINVSNVSEGVYFVNATLIDIFGNKRNVTLGNLTINSTKGAITYFVNNSFTLVNNVQQVINRTNEANSTITIFYTGGEDLSGATLLIASYDQNPSVQAGIPTINKFLELSISRNFSWTFVQIFYNVYDVPSGYGEGNLRIYKLYPNSSWMPFVGSYGGVNTTDKYVWANTTSFSLFGAFILPTCSDSIQNQDETGTDCGGVCSACSSPTTTLGSSGSFSSGGTITTTTSTSTITSTTATTTTATTSTTTSTSETPTTTTPPKKTGESRTDTPFLTAGAVLVAIILVCTVAYAATMKREKIVEFISRLKKSLKR